MRTESDRQPSLSRALAHARFAIALAVLAALPTLVAALALPASAHALQKVPVSAFEPSSGCSCHREFRETWGESMHAQALSDPIYRTKLAEANKATDGKIGPFCETCHGPVAAMGGVLGKKPKSRPRQANEGITCDFCHQMKGAKGIGDSAFVVAGDGSKRAQRNDSAAPAHETKRSKFHESAEFCGTCHDVNHPGNGLALEATYTEWKNGPYAAEGIVCQDCHMTPGPGVKRPNPGRAAPFGVEREHVYTMTFVGGNTALGPRETAEERLRAAADLDLEVPDRPVAPGTPYRVVARVTNVGAGHYLPTGVTDLRRMWLEVVVVDEAGRELLRERRVFGTEFADEAGNHPVDAWEAASVVSDDRIAPGDTATQEYEAQMPAKGTVKVTAALYYQGAPAELADKAGVDVPVTRMAKSSATVRNSADEPAIGGGFGGVLKQLDWLTPGVAVVLGIAGVLVVLGLGVFVATRRAWEGRD